MRKAETRVIQIKDVDDDLDNESVLRFLEFAYRGDYTVPSPDIVITPKDVGELSQLCQANPLPTWLAVGPWMLVLPPHKLSTVGQATLFWI